MAPAKSTISAKKRKLDDEDFVYTIYSDNEEPPNKRGKQNDDSQDSELDDEDGFDPDFDWEDAEEVSPLDIDGLEIQDGQKDTNGSSSAPDLNQIIESKRSAAQEKREGEDSQTEAYINMDDEEDEVLADNAFGMDVNRESDIDSDGEEDEDDSNDNASDASSVATPEPHPDDLDHSGSETQEDDAEERAKQKAFYAPEESLERGRGVANSFLNMNLSRQILRGITAAGYSKPTPIQGKTIPMALQHKDIVGSAVTGSGKTAAFLVPILERLLYRDARIPKTRVVILTPTRELAMQCHEVATKLATHTNIRFCLAVGGLSIKAQEVELRLRPEVVIATPGRFIDHMRNSLGFAVDQVEVLVLDEADRMLEDGFADELDEILKTLPKSRQTMLFSATMTSSVDRLISVGLKRPHRIMVDPQKQTVGTLVQQFVKLRPKQEDKRMGYLIYLCKKRYTNRTIIFFKEKRQVHVTRIIFGLLGLSCAELHGAMKQQQRIASVENFRDGKVSFLLASDVAARGLDIKGVDTVINYEPPSSQEVYLHRVGRTARAGRKGIACTIYTESERKVMKAVVKEGKSNGAKLEVPVIDPDVASKWQAQVDELEDVIEEVLQEEKVQKEMTQAEMEMTRADNLIRHEDEIKARPKRTWFQSEKEKQLVQEKEKQARQAPKDPVDKLRAKLKAKHSNGKLSNKDKKRLDAKTMRREQGSGMAKKQLNAASVLGAKSSKGKTAKTAKKVTNKKAVKKGARR